jgi:polyketide biosynthesis acyl carrier protein
MTSPEEHRRREITTVVHDAVATILPGIAPTAITGDRHLKDLGADSVDRVEIILTILQRLRVDEPMASFAGLRNIDALVDFLWRREAA